tara:strand:+ start:403 stop:639 length:237 start_codon:yes stop_codon:yes gene_type:complete
MKKLIIILSALAFASCDKEGEPEAELDCTCNEVTQIVTFNGPGGTYQFGHYTTTNVCYGYTETYEWSNSPGVSQGDCL